MEAHAGRGAESGPQVKAAVNRLGKDAAEDIAAFKYNTALAHMMETLNALGALVEPETGPAEAIAARELCHLTQILAPYAPFLAQRCWARLGGEGSVHASAWPPYETDLELEKPLVIAIQVNGKLRGTVEVSRAAAESEIRRLAEAQPGVAKFLEQGELKKVIYAPGRTINFVVK